MKEVKRQDEWNRVAEELASENLKLMSYDSTLLSLVGNLNSKKILDYGCGPGVLVLTMQRLGGDVRTFDISPEMRDVCGQKIGHENVYPSMQHVQGGKFDVVICNLVLCIVSEEEVANISRNISSALSPDGTAYVGFCNPLIFDVPESALDLRYATGNKYEENHVYRKLKKEGRYEILEMHRPIEWYKDVFNQNGLEVADIVFTPEYELHGRSVRDFIIFKLQRGEKNG